MQLRSTETHHHKQDRTQSKTSYCTEYLDYIYLDKIGKRIKLGYITQHFPAVLDQHDMRRIRYHDLRHSCASLLLANGVSMKEIQVVGTQRLFHYC
ncbi:tyrosine-type recombinase/integrase [Paenibacillus sp. BR2-3]|uniref:tyrosine-type recombinase/integrase n=1 Tax=Paenibacillus sp. BR2-3 TaxID=3048494 RepID=UPI003977B86F